MKTAEDWYNKYENQCHITDALESQIDCLKAKIARLADSDIPNEADIVKPWDRAPDKFSTRVFRPTNTEIPAFSFVEGERCVSIEFYPGGEVEMCGMSCKSYGWTLHGSLIFNGNNTESRDAMWIWLCCGIEPPRELDL